MRRVTGAWVIGGGIALVLALLAWPQTDPREGDGPPAAEEAGREAPSAPHLLGGTPPDRTRPAGPPDPAPERGAPETSQAANPIHVVRGRVTDARTGAPVSGARVLCGEGDDARLLRFPSARATVAATDERGNYLLRRPLGAVPVALHVTVLARGFRSPHAVPESEGEVSMPRTRLSVAGAGSSRLDSRLEPGLDIAGVVVDEAGAPLPGVTVVVTENTESSTGYVEYLATDDAGTFTVHDLRLGERVRPGVRGTLDFTHPTHVAARVDDVYALEAAARAALRVVMPRGLTLAGRLLHSDGAPAVDRLVEAFRGEPNENRRGATTDAQGRFRLVGLAPGALILRALDGARLESVRRDLTLLRSEDDLDLKLEPMPFVRDAAREHVLGMEVVTVPAEHRAALGLYERHALLITGLGDEVPAGLRKYARVGDVLWHVGRDEVASARDVAAAIVRAVDRTDHWRAKGGHPPPDPCSVRIVLGIRRADLDGTNTQALSLPRAQVEALRTWLAEHPKAR